MVTTAPFQDQIIQTRAAAILRSVKFVANCYVQNVKVSMIKWTVFVVAIGQELEITLNLLVINYLKTYIIHMRIRQVRISRGLG